MQDGRSAQRIGNQSGVESDLILMESERMQTKTVFWFAPFIWFVLFG